MVVLVPGFTMSAADWRGVGYVARLALSRRVLSIDPLGHGQSDTPHEADAYLWPNVAADVIAVMDSASVERAALWGYSRGASLACVAAIEFPERFEAVILGGAGDLAAPLEGAIPAWVEKLATGDWNALWGVYPYSEDDRRYAEENYDPRAFAACAQGRRLSRYVVNLERLAAPALVYCGCDDDPDDAAPSARALGTRLHTLDGLDHDGAFAAIDRVLPLVVAHLESVSA